MRFPGFAHEIRTPAPLRAAISAACRRPEPECIPALLEAARLSPAQAREADALARRLAQRLREGSAGPGLRHGLVQGLMHEFSLSSQEGVALMCLAEALLRIPDAATRDALIRDKITGPDWRSHLGGAARPLFVNAATWGLIVTGRLVATHDESGLAGALGRALARGGEPVVRKALDMAMRLLGEQFVCGETIAQALGRARRREAQGFRYSYDMLGEAALTDEDAQRYLAAYEQAIRAIGAAGAGRGIYEGPGVSIKLSALHPRYARAQRERVMEELYPRLCRLARLAREHDIGLNVDAEEADRLELSLDLLERLCFEPALEGWNGVGFVAQAYQKRCPHVIEHLVDLARRSRRRLMVRLVKGAYWDSEIKRAQVDGLEGYPVYTRKAYTDLSYLACARLLLAAPDAVYPQFATHNAHTVAAVMQMAGGNYYAGQYEFQCLHGMGEPLYEQVVGPLAHGGLARPCRIYAPVGSHETLLAYLVRRLLENGANASFVHRIADASIPLDALVADPVETVERLAAAEGGLGLPHPAIPLPRDLYRPQRVNSTGIDLASDERLSWFSAALLRSAQHDWRAAPIVAGRERADGPARAVLDPADRGDSVGTVIEATADDIAEALEQAARAAPAWGATAPQARAAALERASERLQAQMGELAGLMVREAGKTWGNAVAEVREAIDFLRYYAAQVRDSPDAPAPRPLGPLVCISPWNFPLAIFTGQVAAALAAGNTVLAKPAEQTPLVAAQAVRLMHAAGIPFGALQLLPGRGETVGAALAADARIRGVLFTGSTEVARTLQRTLAGRLDEEGRPLVLIAETGGQNAMIVDSSALAEQAVADIVTSAFDSAGQRCSALRVLCVQAEAAERVLAMLRGAMRELRIGAPEWLSTDVGPVIDDQARDGLLAYIEAMRARGHRAYQAPLDARAGQAMARGSFVAPTLIELAGVGELGREVFGPVLHVVRYARSELGRVLEEINATGYGLTLGLHTRIDETVDFVTARVRAGNRYVNRNMIGAVVGVQPFGGEGLSGTGPKAGGPLYLRRLVARAAPRLRVPGQAAPGQAFALPAASGPARVLGADSTRGPAPLASLQAWLQARGDADSQALAELCVALARAVPDAAGLVLPGPTGERNTWTLHARAATLCIAGNEADRLFQLAHVLAAGSTALWPDEEGTRRLHDALPPEVRARVRRVADAHAAPCDAVLVHGDARTVCEWSRLLAGRDGPIVAMQACASGERTLGAVAVERLMIERSLSVNTAAAGGNASLMSIG
ncbi:MAG: trifunctional transcriptional regulator/proline dehydrogenase/L-glutamate gamma-semialdehyde dehydrogenase [Burkholderiales bacterium 70-64]|nr:MAG: trifunctional transcriptional regulator/proline dehydrogenase/L-glutamate gamma-semialdehyde dehydrogenase [Burkholderiales bacterium 70-64]